MGTSVSSKGPKGGCPLIPPWVESEVSSVPSEKPKEKPETKEGTEKPKAQPQKAPDRRFSGARSSLGRFASRSGDHEALGRGLGHYSATGLGGSRNAALRMSGGARKAGALYSMLSGGGGGRKGATPLPGLSSKELAGKSSKEIADIIIEHLCPIDGTQDAEASRNAMSDALGEFIDAHPEADLTALSAEQAQEVTELFVGEDIYRRAVLDIGQSIHKNAPTAREALARLEEIRHFIKESVLTCFREDAASLRNLSAQQATSLVTTITESVFRVFESYL